MPFARSRPMLPRGCPPSAEKVPPKRILPSGCTAMALTWAKPGGLDAPGLNPSADCARASAAGSASTANIANSRVATCCIRSLNKTIR